MRSSLNKFLLIVSLLLLALTITFNVWLFVYATHIMKDSSSDTTVQPSKTVDVETLNQINATELEPTTKSNVKVAPTVPTTVVVGMLEEVNGYRMSNGLNELREDKRLLASSQLKANDMVEQNYWAHTNPQGRDAASFMKEATYPQVYWGENLARCFQTVKGIVNAWINSPSHNRVLLGDFTEAGFTMAFNAEDNCYYVAGHFGRR